MIEDVTWTKMSGTDVKRVVVEPRKQRKVRPEDHTRGLGVGLEGKREGLRMTPKF